MLRWLSREFCDAYLMGGDLGILCLFDECGFSNSSCDLRMFRIGWQKRGRNIHGIHFENWGEMIMIILRT